MRGYLLDTSIISMFAPGRRDAGPEFTQWMADANEQLHLSTVTVFEVTQGITKLRRAGGHDRADAYMAWLKELTEGFGSRMLALDETSARTAGPISEDAFARGRHPGMADIFIASTARAHSLVLLTRNLRHFVPLGIEVVDPLVTLPA